MWSGYYPSDRRSSSLQPVPRAAQHSKELSELRMQMIDGLSSRELAEILLQVDALLAQEPHHPQARLLKSDIVTRLSAHAQSLSPIPSRRPPGRHRENHAGGGAYDHP